MTGSINRTPVRVALYTRVSTIEQAEEGYSIDEQERLLTEYCTKHDMEVYKCYSDKGISGKDIKHRPALKELLNDAEDKVFDMVLSWKINRISRKLSDVLKIVELFERNNITFKSYSEPFETSTPAGKMQFQMMALIGEFERGTIAQNVKMGMCAKAKSGEWCGGIVLGYDLKPVLVEGGKRNKTELVINAQEAHIVRTIYEEFVSGSGYKAITNKINKEGYRTKKGNFFSVNGVRDILLNPIYIGKVRYNLRQNWSEKRRRNINKDPILVDGRHEPIIDEDSWTKARTIMDSSSGKPSRIYDGQYPLTGLLRCPECGSGMVISRTTNIKKDGTKKRMAYYACGNWKNKGTSVCHSNTIRVDRANDYVFTKITELISNDKMVKCIVDRINHERNNKTDPAKKALEIITKDLMQLEKKKAKLFDAYENDVISMEDFRNRNDELNEKLTALHTQKSELDKDLKGEKLEYISFDLVKTTLKNFSLIMSSDITNQKQKKLLHMIISEITVNEKREVDSINIKLTDQLINYLKTEKGVSKSDTPSVFAQNSYIITNQEIKFSI